MASAVAVILSIGRRPSGITQNATRAGTSTAAVAATSTAIIRLSVASASRSETATARGCRRCAAARDPVAQPAGHRADRVGPQRLARRGGVGQRNIAVDGGGRIAVAQRRSRLGQELARRVQLGQEELGEARVRLVLGVGAGSGGRPRTREAVREPARREADRAVEPLVDLVDERLLDVGGQHEVGADPRAMATTRAAARAQDISPPSGPSGRPQGVPTCGRSGSAAATASTTRGWTWVDHVGAATEVVLPRGRGSAP